MLKKLNSLNFKFGIITFFTYMLLVTVILVACYNHFFGNTIRTYENIAQEILNHASDDIIIDHIPDYLSGNYDRDEYARTQAKLESYVSYYNEIYYLYGYKINKGSNMATVIFDAQTDHDTVEKLGDDYELEHDIADNLDKLERGEPIKSLVDNTEWGFLLTCSKPLIGSDGECKGYLFVDFNLTKVREKNQIFILQLFCVVFLLTLLILYGAMLAVSKRITGPIEKMYNALKSFKFETTEDREQNIMRLRQLKIKTNPEIQSLYDTLVSTTLESYTYQQEYKAATEQLGAATEKLGVASEMAYTDALTGLQNKNAFEMTQNDLQKKIDSGESLQFAVIMIDVNNLKYVNDTFGHDMGDSYLKGCCKIASTIIKNSPIYRIGGDEFVAILKDNDYEIRQTLLANLKKSFKLIYGDESKKPWERYSAAVGLSYYSGDVSVNSVIKRADNAMYEAKAEFKKKHGSYR